MPATVAVETVMSEIGLQVQRYRKKADDTKEQQERLENLRIVVALQDVAQIIYANHSGDWTGKDWNETYRRYFQ